MIKTVIFDYGNVIQMWNSSAFYRALENGRTSDAVKTIFKPLSVQYETGKLTTDQFFHSLATTFKPNLSAEKLKNLFIDVFTDIPETIRLIQQLKQNGYRVQLLSNTNDLDFKETIFKHFTFHHFDAVTLSYEVGFMKPAKEIYEDALRKAGCLPGECIFIDDIKENVEGATSIGMKGIVYKDAKSTAKTLAEFGVRL